MDAIALLRADHRQVEKWFSQFEKTRAPRQKEKLAEQICNALKVHATIEEEIFYPAFIEATEDKDLHHEAVVEHAGAKKLIAEIEALNADDEYYDAKVVVLSEMNSPSAIGCLDFPHFPGHRPKLSGLPPVFRTPPSLVVRPVRRPRD